MASDSDDQLHDQFTDKNKLAEAMKRIAEQNRAAEAAALAAAGLPLLHARCLLPNRPEEVEAWRAGLRRAEAEVGGRLSNLIVPDTAPAHAEPIQEQGAGHDQ